MNNSVIKTLTLLALLATSSVVLADGQVQTQLFNMENKIAGMKSQVKSAFSGMNKIQAELPKMNNKIQAQIQKVDADNNKSIKKVEADLQKELSQINNRLQKIEDRLSKMHG